MNAVKTYIQIPPDHSRRKIGNTPPFKPEEIVKDFWQWQGFVYIERPNGGGPKVHPTIKRPITAQLVDESKYGRLWQLTFDWRHHSSWARPINIRVLNVWNATLEKDGTRQQFTIRVPQTMRTAHEAVAWSFNLRPDQYYPTQET